jgi:uncharacterized repeat protein (TIGR01451 family)
MAGFEFAANGLNSADVVNQAGTQTEEQPHSILAGLPLIFEPNQGQAGLDPADRRARFVSHGSGYSMVLGDDGAYLTLAARGAKQQFPYDRRVESFQMKLVGANSSAVPSAQNPLPGKSNYFIGNDPSKWQRGVPQFARVNYESVYPGISLIFYGNDGHLEYDFQVAPGSDPAQAELEFDSAKQVSVQEGALVVRGDGGSVQLNAPNVYQNIDGQKRVVDAAFVLRGANRAGFSVGAYDHSRELIIDPVLNFSTYFGGNGDEHSTSVAVDGSFNIYLAGSTTSTNLPASPGAVQTTLAGAQNVYIAKIQAPLSSVAPLLLDLTYLGGSGTDSPVGIKVDGEGNPFVVGTTSSPNFPTTATNAYQPTPESAGTHVFVTKMQFDFTQLNYSSYLSGNGTDIASGMTIDPAGDIYVTGTTTSVETLSTDQFPATNLPQTLPFQNASRAPGLKQFFVTKVNTTAPRNGSIAYSTYFGGGTFDTATPIATGGGIAVDANLNIYFTGTTNFIYSGCSGCSTTDFPILNAYQPCLDTPSSINIVNPQSCSSTTNLLASDAFVAKLNPTAAQGQQLQWSTYLGGTGDDEGNGVALDSGAANVYVVGTTDSGDFVSTQVKSYASYQACLNNNPVTVAGSVPTCPSPAPAGTDAFVARVSNPTNTTGTPTLVTLNYFSYLGGANDEQGLAITVDSNSGAMITGSTNSPSSFTGTTANAGSFPVSPFPSSIQSQLGGGPCTTCLPDAFIARLNTRATVGQTTTASWASFFGGSGTDIGTSIALDVNQNSYLAGETNSANLPVAKALQSTSGGGFDSFVTQLQTALSLSIEGQLSLGTNQQFISAGNPATFTYTVTNNGPDSASGIVVTANLSSVVTNVQFSNVTATISSGTCGAGNSSSSSISCGPISLQSGSTATVTITATPAANSSGSSPISFNGGTVQVMAQGNIVLAQTSVPAQMTDFSMAVNPSNQSITQAGNTATYQVTLTPHPIFTSSISLSCSGLPAASSCNFTSPSVALTNTSGATSTLNITTTARPVTTPAAGMWVRRFYAAWFAFPALAFIGLGRDRKRRRFVGMLLLSTLFGMLLLLPSCSHTTTQTPVSGTPAGSYPITVTAASGGDSKTQTIGLTVP